MSETVPDDGSVNFLRTTGYGSYPIVSCPVTKTGSSILKSFQKLKSMNWIVRISMQVHSLIYPDVHYTDRFQPIDQRFLSKLEIVLIEFIRISFV